MIYSQVCADFRNLGEDGDKKGLNEKGQVKDKVGTLNTYPNSPKQDHFRRNRPRLTKARLGESIPLKLSFFS